MAILQRPYAGQVKNLTPPAAGCGGWFLAVGGVICCGRWAAGLAGCGVGRCWRWAAGCCEVWQGVQAVQLVGCGVIGAALAVLLVSVCFWLAVRVGGVICCGRWGAGGVIDRAGPSLIRTDPAGDPVQRAGSRASSGKVGKRKRPGQTARRALLLWPLVCTGGNGSGGVRPGAGGGADLLAVPVGMVSAGTVPAVGVPASRLALAVLHPGQFCRLPEGSDSPPNGSEKHV